MLARIFRRLFANEGAGPMLRGDIVPWGEAPLATPIGFEALWPATTPPEGWLDESNDNGLLSRAVFPQLWEFAESSGNILSDAEWQAEKVANGGVVGAFSSGDGGTTFRVPLLRRVFPRAADPNSLAVGQYQGDAIRNITGGTSAAGAWCFGPESEGALYTGGSTGVPPAGQTTGSGKGSVFIDASLVVPTASENRPVTVVRLPIIKAFGVAVNVGTVDLAEIATAVTTLGQLADNLRIPGEIRLLPFRHNALPPGWHFCNGDLYPLSGAVGAALEGLPANFKTD